MSSFLGDQRQHGGLDGRDLRMQAQHGAVALRDDLLVVGVAEEREHRAVDPRAGSITCGDVPLAALRVDPLELRPGRLGVRGEVEVAAVRDPLELRPADREEVLDVARAARVVRQLVGIVRAHAQAALADAEPEVPAQPLVDPVAVPLLRLGGRDEELHLHLLELERAEDEVARRDLVAERLADLRDAERRLATRELRDVLEVDEDALRGLRPQVTLRSRSPRRRRCSSRT